MSLQLINRSNDLKKLRDEGYEVEVREGHLLLHNVPYLTSLREVKRGTLVSTLTLAGDVTTTPDDHQAHFSGELPCNPDGTPNARIHNSSQTRSLAPGVIIDHSFSAKPQDNGGRYHDYYQKMSTYAAILSGPAQTVDPTVTPKTFAIVKATEDESVFKYVDTASSRAAISALGAKLQKGKIAIIGLGGTGSYVLDQVAKTPVQEIHLFDGDTYLQHNAFRSPGAPTADSISAKKNKAEYFAEIYSNMRRGIVAHPTEIKRSNLELLREMNFVFICIDNGPAKKSIIEHLEASGCSFVDVGMGLYLADNRIGGVLRVTSSTPTMRQHIHDHHRISFHSGDVDNEYNSNIQVSELNALNAVLAVIKWKKIMGFYLDLESEHFSTYTLDGNCLSNEDKYEPPT